MRPVILYSSFQNGEYLPAYIRYVLLQLAPLGEVKFLTNFRRLAAAEIEFLEKNDIELFFTENKGFDFGMWKRYLEFNPLESSTRLLLLNDSIVYYQKNLGDFIHKAELSEAKAVALLENASPKPHLQSFFLYLKDSAISVFKSHLQETPLKENFEDTIQFFEIPFSEKLKKVGIQTFALFQTETDPIFSYRELIMQKCGFVKKRLLERRFSFEAQKHFWLHGKSKALYQNYSQLICTYGEKDVDFKRSYFPGYSKSTGIRFLEYIKGIAYRILAFFYFRFLKKYRDRFIRKAI